ncbi:hypothetical protein PHOBOS_127 [Erwinia phage vB_EamM_Phobos]|uniref:hypothetical protein n=1 Tax=Erwinia phage vB_EamM_Phobos TaxID=1883377 RepID=UPI00081CBBB5|nr:hypothetical protein BIZ79_gp127 [Erwinia phage vB_EamM_Phobos]ANZ50317.1 hypothetical protein PHOBOS_127 [Erwinia phage vB_EamM_Phobos]
MLALVMMSAGCDASETNLYYDQQLRREIFKECLASIPKGPEKIDNSNDWQEVVEECGEQARKMSAFYVKIPSSGGEGYYFNNSIKGGEMKERTPQKVQK